MSKKYWIFYALIALAALVAFVAPIVMKWDSATMTISNSNGDVRVQQAYEPGLYAVSTGVTVTIDRSGSTYYVLFAEGKTIDRYKLQLSTMPVTAASPYGKVTITP